MKKVVFVLCLASSFFSYGQIKFDKDELLSNLVGTIESDRPGQALNATTCGVLAFQIQTGFNYTSLDFPFGGSSKNQTVPTNIRFGITDIWELNTSFSFTNQIFNNGLGPTTVNGFPSPEIGLRAAFLKGDRWKPYLAIQANMSIPSKRGTYQQPGLGSSFYLVTSNRFKHISINTTTGISYSGFGGNAANYPYVLNIGTMLTSKLGTFVEAFGSFNNSTLNLDGGFSYLATPNLQLDLFGGWLGDSNWFAEIGFSWRHSFFQKMVGKNIKEIDSILN